MIDFILHFVVPLFIFISPFFIWVKREDRKARKEKQRRQKILKHLRDRIKIREDIRKQDERISSRRHSRRIFKTE
jgi:hypothetical protein